LSSYGFFANRLQEVGYSGSLRSYVEGTIAAGRLSSYVGEVKSRDFPTAEQSYTMD